MKNTNVLLFEKVATLLHKKSGVEIADWIRSAMVRIFLDQSIPSRAFDGADLIIMDTQSGTWQEAFTNIVSMANDVTKARVRSAISQGLADARDFVAHERCAELVIGYLDLTKRCNATEAVVHFRAVITEVCPESSEVFADALLAWVSMVPTRVEAIDFAKYAIDHPHFERRFGPVVFAALCRESPSEWLSHLRLVQNFLGEELETRSPAYLQNYRSDLSYFLRDSLPTSEKFLLNVQIRFSVFIKEIFIGIKNPDFAIRESIGAANRTFRDAPSISLDALVKNAIGPRAKDRSAFELAEFRNMNLRLSL